MQAMRIVLVEDNSDLLKTLQLFLSAERDIDIVGAFATAEECLANIEKCAPDIILVDIDLPGMSGVELIETLKGKNPSIDFIVYTGYGDKKTFLAAIRAGAAGYLLKGTSPRELIEALHELRNGGVPMSPDISRMLIQEVQDKSTQHKCPLTKREKSVLKCIDEDLTYKEISEKLNISRHTVHTHIKNGYEKLNADSRKDALKTAKRKGCI